MAGVPGQDKEYAPPEAQLSRLEDACARASWSARHESLLERLADVLPGIRFTAARNNFTGDPGRILDASGGVVAQSFRAWAEDQLRAHGDSALRVWEAFRDKDWTVTWWTRERRYYWAQTGIQPWQGSQLAIVVRQEFPGARMFSTSEWDKLEDRNDLMNLRGHREPAPNAKPFGPGHYAMVGAIDMEKFYRLGQDLHGEFLQRAAAVPVTVTPSDGAPSYSSTMGREQPEAYRHKWRVQRWFEDWAYSSAGRSGAIAGHHWAFDTSDWPSGNRYHGRQLNFVPMWTHTAKIAALENTHRLNDHELYGRLLRLQERTGGVPFGWYFYMLHGNLVKDECGIRVHRAAQRGVIDLPEHDYRLLAGWAEDRYGF